MLHDQTITHIRNMLIEGEIQPGARIPEQALCRMLGISRTPLREALKVLAAEGHVVLLPNRGARAVRLTRTDIRDLFEVSAALELAAGEAACQRISDAQITEVAKLHADMVDRFRAKDLAGYYALNRTIHEAIVHASENRVLIGFYESVSARIRRARYVAPMTDDHWQMAVAEHEAMLNALQRRDGAMLALILKTHLRHKALEIENAGFAGDDPLGGSSRPVRMNSASYRSLA